MSEPPEVLFTIHVWPRRPLSPGYRALLDRLLKADHVTPELRRQCAATEVDGLCSCGCPSVYLWVPPELPHTRFDPSFDEVRAPEDADVTASGTSPEGRNLDVILHVTGGQPSELEVWATDDGPPGISLPDPATLHLR